MQSQKNSSQWKIIPTDCVCFCNSKSLYYYNMFLYIVNGILIEFLPFFVKIMKFSNVLKREVIFFGFGPLLFVEFDGSDCGIWVAKCAVAFDARRIKKGIKFVLLSRGKDFFKKWLYHTKCLILGIFYSINWDLSGRKLVTVRKRGRQETSWKKFPAPSRTFLDGSPWTPRHFN